MVYIGNNRRHLFIRRPPEPLLDHWQPGLQLGQPGAVVLGGGGRHVGHHHVQRGPVHVLRGQEGHHGAAGVGKATENTLFVPSPEEAAEDARDAVQIVDPAAVVEIEGVEQERLQHL